MPWEQVLTWEIGLPLCQVVTRTLPNGGVSEGPGTFYATGPLEDPVGECQE